MCRCDVDNAETDSEVEATVEAAEVEAFKLTLHSWPPLQQLLQEKCPHPVLLKRQKNRWQKKAVSWLADVQSSVERVRRVRILWNVCERLLSVAPSHRPRHVSSFAKFVSKQRTVQSFTCHPAELAYALGAFDVSAFLSKAKPPIPDKMMETLPLQAVTRAKYGWERLSGNMSLGALARFLASQAFNQKTYRAEDVLDTLSRCGLVRLDTSPWIDCSQLTRGLCAECLPAMAKDKFLWRSWNVFARKTQAECFIPMSLELVPHIIGKQGAALKVIQGDIARTAKSVAPSTDAQCRLRVETREEEIERRRFEEQGKHTVEIREKVFIKDASIRLAVTCTETVVGVASTAKPACIVLDAASRIIRAHVNDTRARLVRRSKPRKPKSLLNKQQPCLSADTWLQEYTDMKERNGQAMQAGTSKLYQWRSNKHYRRPPPCWCRYEWRGGRHKINQILLDDIP